MLNQIGKNCPDCQVVSLNLDQENDQDFFREIQLCQNCILELSANLGLELEEFETIHVLEEVHHIDASQFDIIQIPQPELINFEDLLSRSPSPQVQLQPSPEVSRPSSPEVQIPVREEHLPEPRLEDILLELLLIEQEELAPRAPSPDRISIDSDVFWGYIGNFSDTSESSTYSDPSESSDSYSYSSEGYFSCDLFDEL